MVDNVHFSSDETKWETPDNFFEHVQESLITDINFDVCATPDNAKCDEFFTPSDDALSQPWPRLKDNYICWMNPPYGREIVYWVKKAAEESQEGSCIVALLPCRTDTRWWHDYVMGQVTKIYLVKGRLKFKGAQHSAPFPSCVVVYTSSNFRVPLLSTIERGRE